MERTDIILKLHELRHRVTVVEDTLITLADDDCFKKSIIILTLLMESEKLIGLGRGWLGKLLAYYGESNPYPENENLNDIVHPAADYAGMALGFKEDVTTIQQIKIVRNHIEAEIIDPLVKLMANISIVNDVTAPVDGLGSIAILNAYSRIVESKMLLGEVLPELVAVAEETKNV